MLKALKLLYLFPFLTCTLYTYGQEQQTYTLQMRHEIQDGKVLIRWAPSSAAAWQLLNEYGVRLERQTIVKEGKVCDEPEEVILATCLKPDTTDRFKQIAEQYSYGAIIAQAVFGESFEVSGGGYDVATIIALSEELQQRYALSLYAADLCFPAAVVAGWGFQDTSAKNNEKYLYKVISMVPPEKMNIVSGSLFVDMQRKERFSKPLEFRGNFTDGNVLLSWNYRILEKLYNAYILERSTDNIHFLPLSETPVTQMESTSKSGQLVYIDSIQNNITYYYRLTGITPFGTKGQYSDTISGMGIAELKVSPFITTAKPNHDGSAVIEWAFDTVYQPQIQHFILEHSEDDKHYNDLMKNIKKTERQITVPDIPSTNYFVVTAVSITGKKLRSFSAFVQAVDTTPPVAPVGLTAITDTSGSVKLSWKANIEKDIYGYRVYKKQTQEEEFISLNDIAIKETAFTDSVELKSLNSKIYYAIVALDERYNQSDFSAVIEVKKPEIIPPTPPFIEKIKVENGKNTIYWVSGGEKTLVGYNLYRKSDEEKGFELLATVNGSQVNFYEDNLIENNQKYVYQVKSRTEGSLLSDSSPVYKVTGINKSDQNKSKIEFNVNAVNNSVKLLWNYAAQDLIALQIFKKNETGEFELFREGMVSKGEIEDSNVVSGKVYHYILVIKTKNSTPITITKTVTL